MQAERQARLQKRRTHKGHKRSQKRTQAGREQTRKHSRSEAPVTCDDFSSQKEAIEWMKRSPNPFPGTESEIEIRQVFEAEDFGAEFTPELREQEERQRAQMAATK